MLKLAEYTNRIEDLRQRVKAEFDKAGIEYTAYKQDDGIKIVFAGQYSAGKSSLIKALTGLEDIEIGPGITTMETHSYEWEGLEIIDTPGIHTQLRPDHDEISYKAISSADMLVFVVTNELFDAHIAEHFRKLAIDNDKAAEMILVVNKMQRTPCGNVKEQQDLIKDDLSKVLSPYTPDDLKICFVDIESYLESISEDDPEISEELINRSGFQCFIDTLNSFVNEKKIASKLTTELYVMEEQLNNAIKQLEPGSTDTDIDALEENYMQQHHTLIEARNRLKQEINDIYITASAEIRNLGLESANLLYEGCKQENVEKALAEAISESDKIIDNCQQESVSTIKTRLDELGQTIEKIEESEFSNNLKARLYGKFEGLPDGIKSLLGSAGPGFQKAGQTVMNNAFKTGATGGLKLTNFSGSNIHNIVLNAGHAVGFKFKPWQAIKITRGLAVAGNILSVVGVGINIFMQIKNDKDELQVSKDLRLNRQNIRSQFNSAANGLEDYGRDFVNNNVVLALEPPISDVNDKIAVIRSSRDNKCSACIAIETLYRECKDLIREIHTA